MKDLSIRFLGLRPLPVILAVVAVVFAASAIGTGWQQDDLVHRYFLLGNPDFSGQVPSPLKMFEFLNGDPQRTLGMMDVGVIPWWTLPTLRLSFWRPLSALSHWLDYLLWPGSGVMMHAQSLFWFGALVFAAAHLYRRFFGPTWVAGLAALLFALDDSHGLAAGWLANRNALVAGLFGILTLLAHDRWRRSGWRPGMFLGPLSLLLALLGGEAALGVTGYLIAYAFFVDGGTWQIRLRSLLPYALVAAAWLTVYGMLGYGTRGSGFYVDPLSEPLGFVWAVVWKAPLLLADQWALPPSSVVLFVPDGVVIGLWIWAVVLLALLGVLLGPLVRRDRLAGFWLTGMLLSIPLVCSTMPHSRLLLFSGIGAFGLLARWIAGIPRHTEGEAGSWRRVTERVALIAMVVVHIPLAGLLLPMNAKSAAFAQPYIQDAAERVDAGPGFADQDLVILNHPIVFYGHSFTTARLLAGQPAPRRLRVLAPGTVPLRILREDDFTLVVQPEGGYLNFPFDNVFRGPSHPLRAGDQVSLARMTVEVRTVTDDGRPDEVAFRFTIPLEDASLRWLMWDEGGYQPFILPSAGESRIITASRLTF